MLVLKRVCAWVLVSMGGKVRADMEMNGYLERRRSSSRRFRYTAFGYAASPVPRSCRRRRSRG